MIFCRIKILINRYIKAKFLGFTFLRSKNFVIPKSIKLNNKSTNLSAPNEHGVKMSFIDIFLDDVYKLDLINKLAKKNNIKIQSIIDIGGNCGFFSIAARGYFPKSIIHCYEPNLLIKKYLKLNTKLNYVKYFSEAVGKDAKMVSLKSYNKESVLSRILPSKSGSTPQVSFHSVYKRIKTDTIDIVKMDCEGSEWEILKEFRIWKKVKFLTMEYHLGKNKYNYEKIINAINKIGFNIVTRIDKSKKVSYGIVLAYNPIYFYK